MQFAILGSGSRGNSTLVKGPETLLLIDCGFSLRETTRRLARLGVTPDQLDAILVTHEHSDHCHGVELLARKHDIPVYLSQGTLKGMDTTLMPADVLGHGYCVRIGELEIETIGVAHDAREPTQFIVSDGVSQLGIMTDLGHADDIVMRYRQVDALIIEANHDVSLLRSGPYPAFLKTRVGGRKGHLNNHQSAELVAEMDWRHMQHLVLAHLSEKNNTPQTACNTFVDILGCEPDRLRVAHQNNGLGWCRIAPSVHS